MEATQLRAVPGCVLWQAPAVNSSRRSGRYEIVRVFANAVKGQMEAYEITAELPGLDENNIQVKLANGVLSIKGEKREEKEEKQKDYYRRERSFGSFERSFQVPEGIDTDKIAASFKNGILSVTLPKSVEAQKQAKKIEVKGA